MIECRQYPRVPVDLQVYFSTTGNTSIREGTMFDLSAGGCAVTSMDGRKGRFSGPNPYSGHRPGVSDHDRVGGGSMEQTRGVRSRVPRGLGDRSESAAPSPAYQNDLSHPPQLILLSSGYSKIWGWSARSAIDRLPGTAIPGVPSVRNAVNLPISAPGRLNNIEFPARIS